MGPRHAHGAHRVLERHSELHEQARRDHARTAETTPAVYQHPTALGQDRPELGSRLLPPILERPIRSPCVLDRQVEPRQTDCRHRFPHVPHMQLAELLLLHEGHHGLRTPTTDALQVGIEITIPLQPGASAGPLLPGAKGHTDHAPRAGDRRFADAKRRGRLVHGHRKTSRNTRSKFSWHTFSTCLGLSPPASSSPSSLP